MTDTQQEVLGAVVVVEWTEDERGRRAGAEEGWQQMVEQVPIQLGLGLGLGLEALPLLMRTQSVG